MEKVKKFLSWEIIATAACIILFTVTAAAWNDKNEEIKKLDTKIEKKVSIEQYQQDISRIERKIDKLIDMHMQSYARK